MKKLSKRTNITLFILLIVLVIIALFELVFLVVVSVQDSMQGGNASVSGIMLTLLAAASLNLAMYFALVIYYGKKSFAKTL